MDRRRAVFAIILGVTALLVLVGVGRCTSPPAVDRLDAGLPPPTAPATSTSEVPGSGDAATGVSDYPRTPEGAVAAATAYGLALDGPGLFDPTHRSSLLDEIAAEGAHADLSATFAAGAELIHSELGIDQDSVSEPGFVWRVVPGGWQLRSYGPSGATVAVWAAAVVLVDDRLLVEPGWQTSEVELIWERDGWRLLGFSTEQGPDPAFAAGPGVDAVGQRINEFAPFRYWPDEAHREVVP